MKFRFLALVALILGMVSCQREINWLPIGGNADEVSYQLTVGAEELATRAGVDGAADSQDGLDSAFGAIDYLQGTDWTAADLRYTLEVYDWVDGDDYSNPVLVKDRMVQVVDEYKPVVFDLRLVPGRKYHFVVFADFVAEGEADKVIDSSIAYQKELGLCHTIGNTLADITIKADAINNELADAYFATKDITVENSAAQDIILKRPYGKLRVIATDLAELNLNLEPKSVKVEYTATHPQTFNAITGNVGAITEDVAYSFSSTYNDGVGKTSLANHFYTEGYDARKVANANNVERHSHMTLFTDYILAIPEGQTPYHFTMTVYDGANTPIKETEFVTDIPIERNHLTTVIGNLLTTASEIEVRIDDNFSNEKNEPLYHTLLETLMNGGKFTLTEDLTLTDPAYLKEGATAIIDLNGHKLTYTGDDIMTRVEKDAKLVFIGDKAGSAIDAAMYIASANEGGEIYVKSGNYKANVTCFQANGGKVYIEGGHFSVSDSQWGATYLLNHIDSKKNIGLIEVTGGSFVGFDPANNAAENPAMSFVKDGYVSTFDGVDTYFVEEDIDFVATVDANGHVVKYEVYNGRGVAKWLFEVVENDNLDVVLEVKRNITMPQFELVADGDTYKFDTSKPITISNGTPSGSNWIPVCANISDFSQAFTGHIEGNGYTIKGVRIVYNGNHTGLIGVMWNGASVKNLNIEGASITGTTYVGGIAGRAQNGTLIENVNVINSTISGKNSVGGVVGYNYRRKGGASGQGYNEAFAIVKNATVDAATKVIGSDNSVGGIVGNNYGAIVVDCENYADVTGKSHVAGICGYSRDYHHDADCYIIGCKSYADATITATGSDGTVAGIVGYNMTDGNHSNTTAPVVACTSQSQIVGGRRYIISYNSNGKSIACYGVKNGSNSISNSNIEASYAYDANGVATDAEINAMNAAIATYNTTAPAEAQCNHTWSANGGLPVLN